MKEEFPYSRRATAYVEGRPRVLLVAAPAVREQLLRLAAEFADADLIVTPDRAEEIHRDIRGAHALIGCPRPLIDDELLRAAGNGLTWIHASGAGVEEFIIRPIVESDIVLTNGRIIQGPEVADHALALLLTLTRNIHMSLRRPTAPPASRPIELRGKTAVVAGLGGIGLLIAERASAFGMRIVGVDADYVPMLRTLDAVVRPERLVEVLAEADVIFNATPHAPRSNPLFGDAEFDAVKRGAYFVNVSRGRTVSTDALVRALTDERLAGAGLDVTDPEPLPPDHPLRGLDNVVLTPHQAGLSEHNRDRSVALIRENIERFVRGLPLLNVVDKSLGY